MIWLFVFIVVFVVALVWQFGKGDNVQLSGLKYFVVSEARNGINIYPADKMPGECLQFPIARYKGMDDYLGEFVADLVPEPRTKAIRIVACRDDCCIGYVPQSHVAAIRAARTLPCVCFCYIAKRNGQYITSCFVNTPGL